MPEKQAIQTRIAERLRERLATLAPKVAERMRPVLGNVPVSKEERQRRWWQEAQGWTPEHELTLLTGMNPDGTPAFGADGSPLKPLSREDVGLLKYENREIDARAVGKGDDDREIALYSKEMSDLGPPAPGPLEMAAMDVGAGLQAQPDKVVGASMPAPPMAPLPLPQPEQGGLY